MPIKPLAPTAEGGLVTEMRLMISPLRAKLSTSQTAASRLSLEESMQTQMFLDIFINKGML